MPPVKFITGQQELSSPRNDPFFRNIPDQFPSVRVFIRLTMPDRGCRNEKSLDFAVQSNRIHSKVTDILARYAFGGQLVSTTTFLCGIQPMVVNNITRLLDAKKVPYVAFELPAEKLGAVETARLLNVPLDQVYKTIVVTRESKGKPILAVIPGSAEVDLKLLAKVLDEKKLHLPTERGAEQLTGLQAGGISPLGLINKGFQVVVDSSAGGFRDIHISGGRRGLNIRLPVDALVNLTNARVETIIRRL